MHRNQRLHLLKQLITDGSASTQVEFVESLAASGIEVTQATISRDLTAIGAVRGPDGYQLPDRNGAIPPSATQPSDGLQRVLREHAMIAKQADSIVVLRTIPGHADFVASELDATPPSGMVGCIAGDDTIFIATTSNKAASSLVKTVTNILRGS
jgi:transcriptional regulator of arginine metabolism